MINVELTAEYTEFYGRNAIRLNVKNSIGNSQHITITYGDDEDFKKYLSFEEKTCKEIFTPEESREIYFMILENMEKWIIKYYMVQNTIDRLEKISHIFFRHYRSSF